MSEDFFKKEYAAKLRLYAMSIAHDRQLAEDTVQDVFLEYAKNPPQADVSAWFYRVCKNKLINKLIREKRKVECSDFFFENLTCPHPSAPAEIEKQERIAELKEKLKTLPAAQKEALMLKYFENFSYAQIAEIMNTNPTNVGNLIFNGMANLRKKLLKDSV